MVTQQTYDITPELLDAYLSSFLPSAVVAERRDASSCPIACAVTDTYDLRVTMVTLDKVVGQIQVADDTSPWGYKFSNAFEVETPEWAKKFIKRVDRSEGGIRAGTARRYLAEVMSSEV